MKLLNSTGDFHWHKMGLDAGAKYKHHHIGEPERYPCVVESEWADNPNGPYEFYHTFTYQQVEGCDKCGHKKVVWPDSVRQAI